VAKEEGQEIIDYGLFEFAAPPRTGTHWFTEAVHRAGFKHVPPYTAHIPFPKKRDKEILRVSLVRNPVSWLESCYTVLKKGLWMSHKLDEFRCLDCTTFDRFIRGYIKFLPGSVGKLFNEYQADSCLRIEDMPWALLELFRSLGVPKSMRITIVGLMPQNTTNHYDVKYKPHLRQMVVDVERELMEAYDYY
jgi:hypothetical protein